MSLTANEHRVVSDMAAARWLQTHNHVYTEAYMHQDPDYISIFDAYSEEFERNRPAIYAELARRARPVTVSSISSGRSDTASAPCPFIGPPAPPAPSPAPPHCNFTQLVVNKRDDSDRVYRSSRHTPPDNILEIVGGRERNPASIEAILEGRDIACGEHGRREWNISPAIPGTNLSSNNLDIRPTWRGDSSSFGFYNAHLTPTEYRISATTHRNTATCILRVYPDIAWEGSITINTSYDNATRNISIDHFAVSINKTDDGRTVSYGGGIAEALRIVIHGLISAYTGMKTVVDTVTAGTSRISVIPPSISLRVNTKWQEIQNNRRCGYYLNLSLNADPLIGIAYNIALGRIAILAIPYIGPLVNRVAGDQLEQFISITLTLSARLNGQVNWAEQLNGGDRQITGSISGVIGIQLEIRGQIARDFTFVAINCGVRGGARSSFTVTVSGPNRDAQGAFIGLTVNFDGLTVYAGAYCRSGVYREERGNLGDQAGGANDETTYTWIRSRQLVDERAHF